MTTTIDIIEHVASLSGHGPSREEGVQHGDASCAVTGVTVSWMATPEAIAAAGEAGHELLVSHESLYFPYNVVIAEQTPEGWEDWPVNRQRRALLDRRDLTFCRIHRSADEICILDTFAELLGLGEPVAVSGRLGKVYERAPCTLRALVEEVKQRMGMAHVRVADACDMDREVRRVGLPWGGLGLFVNVGYQQRLVAQGCDVFIAGESDNYGFRFAVESGIPMIETSHELSENPGLRRFTEMLDKAFPDVAFRFFENPCVWQMR